MAHRLKPLFFRDNILGTDEQGRDILSRILYGGRTSLLMGIVPVVLATSVGGLFGIVAGFAGGWLNTLIMRGMDIFFAFPSVLLAVAISGSLGGGMINQLITLSVVLIAAALPGGGDRNDADPRHGFRRRRARDRRLGDVDPRSTTSWSTRSAPVLVYASTLVSGSILLASGLSFLGLGVSPPTPDWGLMLSTLRQAIYVQPVVCAMPGVAILITSHCVQPGQRRAAPGHGRQGLSGDRQHQLHALASRHRRSAPIAAARRSRC